MEKWVANKAEEILFRFPLDISDDFNREYPAKALGGRTVILCLLKIAIVVKFGSLVSIVDNNALLQSTTSSFAMHLLHSSGMLQELSMDLKFT